MDEIQVLIPVAVKSKLTEALKTTLLNQINQNIKSVENDKIGRASCRERVSAEV